MQTLRLGLTTARDWTAHDFGGHEEVFREAQRCAQAVCVRASAKVQFFDEVPWFLARLDQPGVKARCLAQYAQGDPSLHHRVTHEFLDPARALRGHVNAIQDDGSNVSAVLENEIASLRMIPFDDSTAEGPHARAKRIKDTAPAGKFARVASTAQTR